MQRGTETSAEKDQGLNSMTQTKKKALWCFSPFSCKHAHLILRGEFPFSHTHRFNLQLISLAGLGQTLDGAQIDEASLGLARPSRWNVELPEKKR